MPESTPLRLLLVLPSDSYRIDDFLSAAEALACEVLVVTNRHQTLEENSPGKILTLDFLQVEASVNKVRELAVDYPIDAVLATDDSAVFLAASIAEALSLPHNAPASVRATSNKLLLRRKLAGAGLPSPDFQCFLADDDPEEIGITLSYPVVLKPLRLSGSQGVIRANTPKEFTTAFHRIRRLLQDPEVSAGLGQTEPEILVERYVPGQEMAVEALMQAGALSCLAIFDKPEPLEGPYFEETIYVTPSRLPESIQEAALQVVDKAAQALSLTDGPIHAELRVEGETLTIIEIAARSIGGRCAKVLKFGTGLSLESIIIRHALGLPLPSLSRQTASDLSLYGGYAADAVGIMMIPIPKAGHFVSVSGLDQAKGISGVCDVEIAAYAGQKIVPLPEGRVYLGFIFAAGASPASVEETLRRAHAELAFNIAP